MRQQPPTDPTDPANEAGSPDDAPGSSTPDLAADETQAFDQSPYDVPEAPTEEVPAGYAGSYGQAPDPGRTIYSQTTSADPADDDEPAPGRRKWLVPVIVLVILLIAAGVAAVLLLGGDDDEPAPAPTATETASEEPTSEEPTSEEPSSEEPTSEEPTSEEPTEEPPAGELLEDLDDTVSVGDVTFTLNSDGWVPSEAVLEDGALEAYDGLFGNGDDEEIEMLATLWADNDAADGFAQTVVDGLDGAEQVETGDTYTNGDGTYWAFLLEDGRGSYVWTTDRGHAFQVTGSTDYVGQFFSNFPL
ncbi:hypothetical protein [Georgenia sunbinii]|uniref:hypothetical protein n=1 Tax=Georgenia sunbinii TaxID=3117728 RepID=UPI002F266025